MTKKFLNSLMSISWMLCLVGCSHDPIHTVDPNTFAAVVNKFGEQSWEYADAAANCGHYYLNNKGMMMKDSMKKQCHQYVLKLANYLQQDSRFSGVTVEDLETKKTWQYYFKSKKAHGQGLSW